MACYICEYPKTAPLNSINRHLLFCMHNVPINKPHLILVHLEKISHLLNIIYAMFNLPILPISLLNISKGEYN